MINDKAAAEVPPHLKDGGASPRRFLMNRAQFKMNSILLNYLLVKLLEKPADEVWQSASEIVQHQAEETLLKVAKLE